MGEPDERVPYEPANVTISTGDVIRWVDDVETEVEEIHHTVTPDGHSEWAEGSVSEVGETFTHTFDTEGAFPYYCSPHRGLGMTGSITVQAP